MSNNPLSYLIRQSRLILTYSRQVSDGRVMTHRQMHLLASFLHSAEEQISDVEDLLDGLGEIADGNTLRERVERVIAHYVNQMGRWVAKEG